MGDDDEIRVAVTGEAFVNEDGGERQAEIARLAIGDPIGLVREPDNPHDPNAIRCVSPDGIQIGYVGREGARWLAVQLDGGAIVGAEVDDIADRGDGLFRVLLRLSIDWGD